MGFPNLVMLSVAKHLIDQNSKILRFTQNDNFSLLSFTPFLIGRFPENHWDNNRSRAQGFALAF